MNGDTYVKCQLNRNYIQGLSHSYIVCDIKTEGSNFYRHWKALIWIWVNPIEPTQVKFWHSWYSLESPQTQICCSIVYLDNKAYPGHTVSQREINTCVTYSTSNCWNVYSLKSHLENIAWKCYQLDRVLEQHKLKISAWQSGLTIPCWSKSVGGRVLGSSLLWPICQLFLEHSEEKPTSVFPC